MERRVPHSQSRRSGVSEDTGVTTLMTQKSGDPRVWVCIFQEGCEKSLLACGLRNVQDVLYWVVTVYDKDDTVRPHFVRPLRRVSQWTWLFWNLPVSYCFWSDCVIVTTLIVTVTTLFTSLRCVSLCFYNLELPLNFTVFYYESRKRELKIRLMMRVGAMRD